MIKYKEFSRNPVSEMDIPEAKRFSGVYKTFKEAGERVKNSKIGRAFKKMDDLGEKLTYKIHAMGAPKNSSDYDTWWKRNWKPIAALGTLGVYYGTLAAYHIALQDFFSNPVLKREIFSGIIPRGYLLTVPWKGQTITNESGMLLYRTLTSEEEFVRDWAYSKPLVQIAWAALPPVLATVHKIGKFAKENYSEIKDTLKSGNYKGIGNTIKRFVHEHANK